MDLTKQYKKGYPNGFSLIELSVVVVLIGLIVAAVVGGQTLIEQGKLRSQIAQLQKYKVAYNTFKLEYNAIPGDFNKASSYLGTQGGNGNRTLNLPFAAFYDNGYPEGKRFFQHLALAGLIEGDYSNFGPTALVGRTHPHMKLNYKYGMTVAGYFAPTYCNTFQIPTSVCNKTYKAMLCLCDSRSSVGTGNHLYGWHYGTATPKIYYVLDKKIDDGIATSGVFIGHSPHSQSNGACLTGVGGDYLLTNEQEACHAHYVLE